MLPERTRLSFARSMRGKLVFWFLLLSLIPLITVGVTSFFQAQQSLQSRAIDTVSAVRSNQRREIQDYLNRLQIEVGTLASVANTVRQEATGRLSTVRDERHAAVLRLFEVWQIDALDLSHDPDIVNGLGQLSAAVQAQGLVAVRSLYGGQAALNDAGDGSPYSVAHAPLQSFLSLYGRVHGYPDLLLIDTAGTVVYSVAKGDLFATTLSAGAMAQSSLGQIVAQLRTAAPETIAMADIALYGEQTMLFLGVPVFDGETRRGVLVFQLSIDAINTLMQNRTGLGRTGEVFLLGQDKRMRSDSYLDPERHSVLASFKGTVEANGIDTAASNDALAGNTASDLVVDYLGNSIIATYTPLVFGSLQWAVVAKQNLAEAFVPRMNESTSDFYREYAKEAGYPNLFLITATGEVFYSVEQGVELSTNLRTGEYKDTNLGQLVQRVLTSGQAGVADIAPYAGSNNLPKGFLAAPLLGSDGKAELAVAIELPQQELQAIVNDRTGLGATGEIILVGPDKLMRSDSYLDPKRRSVQASFAGGTIAENGVDTVAARDALAGKTSALTTNDYLGIPSVLTFAPIQFGDVRWALIAKQHQSEAFAGANDLLGLTLMIIGSSAIAVTILALWLASTLTTPLAKLTAAARALADGNLSTRATVIARDESGVLADAFNRMADTLRERISAEQKARTEAARLAESERAAKDGLERTVNIYLGFVDRVAAGDLTAHLEVTGATDNALTRLGHVLNRMVESLHTITSQVKQATSAIASSASEILAATTQQASNAAEQSAAVIQTSTTINQVQAIAAQSAARSAQVANGSQAALEVARHGTQVVEETVVGMNNIRIQVESIAQTILSLAEQTQAIGAITTSVSELADQSNLLALNAAIEAARAGEQGKSFAVVAQHVRELAERSKQATLQVREILSEIQKATNAAVMVTEAGTKGVEAGGQLAGQAGQVIHRIATEVEHNAQVNAQMVVAAQQQSAGMTQIGHAINDIQQATAQTLASTRQAERAAQDLHTLAQSLQQATAVYHL